MRLTLYLLTPLFVLKLSYCQILSGLLLSLNTAVLIWSGLQVIQMNALNMCTLVITTELRLCAYTKTKIISIALKTSKTFLNKALLLALTLEAITARSLSNIKLNIKSRLNTPVQPVNALKCLINNVLILLLKTS